MTDDDARRVANDLSRLVLDVMDRAHPPEIPILYASVEPLQTLCANLIKLREFLYATANGDLSGQIDFKGYIAGTLKTLQANLRHITWQTKMVASGDFSQRAEFIGEFSESFNVMVQRLDETLTALNRANEDLLRLAISDPLTGLNNRRHFFELAETEIGAALRYSRPTTIMMFDIDFFKRVNDTYGHACGDAVLKTVAGITSETVRIVDVAGRYGGEEFVVLLPETGVGMAAVVAERLRKQIAAATTRSGGHSVKVTASFGIGGMSGAANPESPARVLADLIDKADQALYASKKGGRNRVTVCQH